MSPGSGPREVIEAVLHALRRSRDLLLDPSPGNIDCCRIAMSQCISPVSGLMQSDRSQWNGPELRQCLLQIRAELRAISNLLDSAAAFRRGMLTAICAADRSHVTPPDSGEVQTVRGVHVLG